MARAPVLQEIEAAPEADRLEEAPHPRETALLHGHAAAEQQLAATFATGRMHHGWLIAGWPVSARRRSPTASRAMCWPSPRSAMPEPRA